MPHTSLLQRGIANTCDVDKPSNGLLMYKLADVESDGISFLLDQLEQRLQNLCPSLYYSTRYTSPWS